GTSLGGDASTMRRRVGRCRRPAAGIWAAAAEVARGAAYSRRRIRGARAVPTRPDRAVAYGFRVGTAEAWAARRRGWRPGHAPVVRLAILVAAVQVFGTSFARHGQPQAHKLDHWGYLLLLAGPAALLFRRRYRTAAVLVTIAATVAYLLLGYPYGPVVFAPVVAMIGALRAGRRLPVWIAAGLAYLACTVLGRL